jgi:hypothetical protein
LKRVRVHRISHKLDGVDVPVSVFVTRTSLTIVALPSRKWGTIDRD